MGVLFPAFLKLPTGLHPQCNLRSSTPVLHTHTNAPVRRRVRRGPSEGGKCAYLSPGKSCPFSQHPAPGARGLGVGEKGQTQSNVFSIPSY